MCSFKPPMALNTLYPYPSPFLLSFYSCSCSLPGSPFLPLRVTWKSRKTLPIPNASSNLSPIGVPHLDSHQCKIEQKKHELTEPVTDSKLEAETEPDQLINFFQNRAQDPNPLYNGSNELVETQLEFEKMLQNQQDQDIKLSNCSTLVKEILKIARNLPENITFEAELGNYKGTVTKEDCINLLKSMSQDGLVKKCLHLFEWMKAQEPVLVTPLACTILFPSLGRAHMSEEIMVLIQNLQSENIFRDIRVYNSAILALAFCQRYDYAWKVYDMLEEMNMQPDHSTCYILIEILRKTKGKTAKDAWDLFQKMTEKGMEWSLDTVSTLIKSFCDEGLKKEALIIQLETEKRGISSNNFVYNTLMDAYVKCDQVEEAEGLFKEMIDRGVKPSITSYNILMDAYSKSMKPEICETLILEMRDFGLDPNVESFTSLVSAYGRQKENIEKANDAFIRMKNHGIKPNTHAYTALIHAYSMSGWYEKVYLTYQNMIQENIKPSIETYSSLLNAFRRVGDIEKIIEIWNCMIQNKVVGTRDTFNIILDCLAKHGLYIQARKLIFEFGKMGLEPTTMTYNMLINAYARGGQHCKIPRLLKEMLVLKLKPDPITYITIIYAYMRVRDFTKAFYFHKQMVKNGQVPDAKPYERLRASLAKFAKTKNKRDRSAILGIVKSKFGVKRKKGKKDEFWKGKKKFDRVALLNGKTRRKFK